MYIYSYLTNIPFCDEKMYADVSIFQYNVVYTFYKTLSGRPEDTLMIISEIKKNKKKHVSYLQEVHHG